LITIGKFKEWIKAFITFKEIEEKEDVQDAFTEINQTIAVAMEAVKDAHVAQTLADILGVDSIDIPAAAPATYESPPVTHSPHYTMRSMPAPDWLDVKEQSNKIMTWKVITTNALAIISMAAELISMGQVDQVLGALNVIIGNTGLTGLGGDFQAIENKIQHQKVWEYYNMRLYRPTIPRERELSNLYRRKIIDSTDYSETMKMLGYDPAWSFGMHEANTRYPGASELLTMYRRGFLSQEIFRKLLEYQGFDIRTSHIYALMKEPLHTTSALIQQVVKEVITPDEFISYMALQGWTPEEAQKYWDVHWRIVSLDDLQDMRNRGLIDDTEYAKQLIIHDYPPEWTGKLTAISYKNPTMLQFRQITEYTDLSDREIDRALKTFGYAPEWEPVMRKFLTSRRLMNERTRMINELEINFVKGYINEDSFRAELAAMGLSIDVIDLRLGRAKLKYGREVKDDWQKIYITAYRNDFITDQQLWEELVSLGIREEIINLIMVMEDVRKKPSAT